MTSRNRIKVSHENKLKLRPFWFGDFNMIRRLQTAMKKNKENSIFLRVLINGTEKVLKIFSPISNSLMGLKNIIKKNIFKTFTKVRTLEDPKEVQENKRKLRRYKCHRKNCGKKPKEFFSRFEDRDAIKVCGEGEKTNRTVINKRYYVKQDLCRNQCHSCREDRAACKTCSSCFDLDPSLPVSSCDKCREKGPVVNLCTRLHNKQPVVYLPDNPANEELLGKFKQRREILKEVSKFCKGDSPQINHCPMCSTIKPQAGDCSCKNCKRTQPIVKLAKRNKNTIVEMCPCQLCSHLHPKVKVCEDCKNTRLNKAKSYYVILSSK